MSKVLAILEVSRKQDYIFSSKKLKDNVERSLEISSVTGSQFIKDAAGDLYQDRENMVYAGGGHTVLQFDDMETAQKVIRRVTEAALRRFHQMEMFAKLMPYDPALSPGENLTNLTKALEEKKAERKAAFRQISFGFEKVDDGEDSSNRPRKKVLEPPEGTDFPGEFEALAGKQDNFIAVVHIDGNNMGSRVKQLCDKHNGSWEDCRESLRRFSDGIQHDFETAFYETVDELRKHIPTDISTLPVCPIILAGDDVCFVSEGKIGLECSRVYLEKLSAMENCEQPGIPYAACAGIALVHTKYPFHRAYDLAEALCSNAKKLGAQIDPAGRISAMDWHIEFGQLKDSLADIRADYETEDGNRMELRPVTVVIPPEVSTEAEAATDGIRTYGFFSRQCKAMKAEVGKVARGKLKELRTVFKQGEVESEFFLGFKEIRDLLYCAFESKNETEEKRRERYQRILSGGVVEEKTAFLQIGSEDFKRNLFFDAIELMDHYDVWEEV